MRPFAVLLATFSLLSARSVGAQEMPIDVNRFHLEAIQGAEAHAAVNNDGPDGQPAVTAVVSKIACRSGILRGRCAAIMSASLA